MATNSDDHPPHLVIAPLAQNNVDRQRIVGQAQLGGTAWAIVRLEHQGARSECRNGCRRVGQPRRERNVVHLVDVVFR